MSETLILSVELQGAGRAARQLRSVGESSKRSSRGVLSLKRALTALAFGAVARQVVKLADGFTLLGNRVRVYTKDQSQANAVTNEIINIANKNRVAVDALALTYQRVTIQADSLGLSQKEVIRLTDILSKSVQIGGSTAQEAAGSLRQFSQALGTDFKSSAQELNSVLEGTPGLADAIARGLGIQTKQLKILAKDGRLSAQLVVEGLLLQGENVDQLFKRITPTIGQALNVANNSLSVFVGRVFQVTGASQAFAKIIIRASEALKNFAIDGDKLQKLLGDVGDALKFLVATKAVIFFANLGPAISVAAAAAVRLKVAFLALNPVTAILGAIGAGLFLVRDATTEVGGELVTFEDIGVSAFQEMVNSIGGVNIELGNLVDGGLANFVRALLNAPLQAATAFTIGFGGLITIVAGFLVDLVTGIGKAMGTVAGLISNALSLKGIDTKAALSQLSDDLSLSYTPAIAEATVDGIKKALTTDFLGEAGKAVGAAVSGTAIGEGARARAASRAAGSLPEATGGDDLDENANVNDQIDKTNAAVERLKASLSPARQAALDYAEAQKIVAKAQKEAGLSAREGAAILTEFATRAYVDATSALDPLTSLTQEYHDQIKLLEETFARLGDDGNLERFEQLSALLAQDFLLSKLALEEYTDTLEGVEAFQLGVTDGIRKFAESLGSTFDAVSEATTQFLNIGLRALNKFVETGKFSFRDFALDVIKSLQKIIIKLLIIKLLQAAGGAATSAGGGADSGSFLSGLGGVLNSVGSGLEGQADGGRQQKGRSVIVGEEGPEIFTPPSSGQIVPNGQSFGQATVNVINVTDPAEIPSAMSTRQGEQVIMNVLRRNRDKLQEISA